MAKASKYNRARIRSRVRRPKRRGGSMMWTVMTAVIVVVGVALVVAQRHGPQEHGGRAADDRRPLARVPRRRRLRDLAAQRARVRDRGGRARRPGRPALPRRRADAHPPVLERRGRRQGHRRPVHRLRRLGALGADSFKLWDGQEHKNGQKCGTGADAKQAEVQWTVGHFGKPWTGTPMTRQPGGLPPEER